MYNVFKSNRIKVQKAFFDSGFWEILDGDSFILEEKSENADLREVEMTNVPFNSQIEMAYLINLESKEPVFGKIENTKTVEKALLLISKELCYVFMFELKSSLQADDENDISAIGKKFKHTIGRISVLLTTFIFGENFKETDIQYKGIVFYNRDNNLINEATKSLQAKDLYKAFAADSKKKTIEIVSDVSGKHQVEVFFCKNPSHSITPNTFSVDFSVFIEEWEHTNFKYSDKSLPQVIG